MFFEQPFFVAVGTFYYFILSLQTAFYYLKYAFIAYEKLHRRRIIAWSRKSALNIGVQVGVTF